MFANPSLCTPPIFVNTPISGLIIDSRRSISPGRDIPASIIARLWHEGSSCHNESGTPIWELKLRGERTIEKSSRNREYIHSFTVVLPRLPVMAITGISNLRLHSDPIAWSASSGEPTLIIAASSSPGGTSYPLSTTNPRTPFAYNAGMKAWPLPLEVRSAKKRVSAGRRRERLSVSRIDRRAGEDEWHDTPSISAISLILYSM